MKPGDIGCLGLIVLVVGLFSSQPVIAIGLVAIGAAMLIFARED